MITYVPIAVIDDMILATGFSQLVGNAYYQYGCEYKCRWLLERISILKEAANDRLPTRRT